MDSEWKTVPLEEFVSIQRGHDLPTKERKDGSVPVMGSSGITGWHDEAKCNGPGVTIGRSGASIGNVCYQENDFWPLNTTLYVTDFKGNDVRYTYFALSSLNLERFNSGTAQPSLNRNYISHVEVPCPPIQTQKRIANILGAFEDKISVNLEINDTIESLVRSIFKSEFRNFSNIHDPKSTSVGEIPRGWEEGTLGDIMEKVTDGVDPDEMPDSTPYIGLGDMSKRSISLNNWGFAEEVSSRKYKFRSGDILFGRLRPNFCKVGIAPVTGISSTDIQIIRSKRGEIWREFLLFYLTDSEFIDYCDQLATGTRMPRVSWDDMCDYSIPIPPVDRVEEFHENVSPMIEMIVSNIQEANTLDSMKNTLHPNIISGKIGPERLCLDKLGDTMNNVIE